MSKTNDFTLCTPAGVLHTSVVLLTEMCERSPDMLAHFRKVQTVSLTQRTFKLFAFVLSLRHISFSFFACTFSFWCSQARQTCETWTELQVMFYIQSMSQSFFSSTSVFSSCVSTAAVPLLLGATRCARSTTPHTHDLNIIYKLSESEWFPVSPP